MFQNNLNQTLPVGIDLSQSVHTISTMDVYNILQDIGSSKLIIDLRKKKDFETLHIKTAVNIPPPLVEGGDISTAIQKISLNKYIGGNVTAKYWNLVFQRIIIYTDAPFTYDLEKLNRLEYDSLPTQMEQSIKLSNWNSELLQYFVSKRKTTLVYVYQGGFETFHKSYPFMCLNVSQKPDTDLYPSEIIEGFLYLGGKDSSNSRKHLLNLKITSIVNMAKELNDLYAHIYKYYRADLDDHPKANILLHFEPIFNFIDECKKNNERVLVHCAMGISRSATIVIAYLMREYQWDYNTAFKYVKSKRSIISPNFGFIRALKDFDKQMLEQSLSTKSTSSSTITTPLIPITTHSSTKSSIPVVQSLSTSPSVQSSL